MKPKISYVLKQVNRVRKALGQKPLKRMPKGDVGDNASCPLAKGFNRGCEVGQISVCMLEEDEEIISRLWRTKKRYTGVDLPKWAKDFVENFDNENYPDLIR